MRYENGETLAMMRQGNTEMYFQTAKISYQKLLTTEIYTPTLDVTHGLLFSPIGNLQLSSQNLGKAHREPKFLRVLYIQISEVPAQQALRWRLSGD